MIIDKALLAILAIIGVLLLISLYFGVRHTRQLRRFKELYKKCVEMHGLSFARELADACDEPWMCLEYACKVFEKYV